MVNEVTLGNGGGELYDVHYYDEQGFAYSEVGAATVGQFVAGLRARGAVVTAVIRRRVGLEEGRQAKPG